MPHIIIDIILKIYSWAIHFMAMMMTVKIIKMISLIDIFIIAIILIHINPKKIQVKALHSKANKLSQIKAQFSIRKSMKTEKLMALKLA